MERKRSEALYSEAKKYFPGGVNSPVRAFQSVVGPPPFMERGKGSRMWDADGNEYIDFCCSWGPLILGHAHHAVEEKVIDTIKKGVSFGTSTALENDLGKLILENHSYIDKIRFVNSGTEAVMSALRLARGVTKRSKVIKFEGCYHGHVDQLLVKAGSGLATFGISTSAGIPEAFAKETIVLPLDDKNAVEEAFEKHKEEIACLIIEPVPANNGLLIQDKEFLQFLRKITSKYGSLLIFDEVISGFRLGFEGAAGFYDIEPDIITFGKIIGGGMPVGAYAARDRIMEYISPDGPVYQAGTLSGNPVAMAAGWAQLNECLNPVFYTELERKSREFVSRIQDYAEEQGLPVRVFRMGSVFWIAFTKKGSVKSSGQIDNSGMDKFAAFHNSLLQKGIYFGPSGYEVGFISAAHTESDLTEAATAICYSLNELF